MGVKPVYGVLIHLFSVYLVQHLVSSVLVKLELYVGDAGFFILSVNLENPASVVPDGVLLPRKQVYRQIVGNSFRIVPLVGLSDSNEQIMKEPRFW